MVIWHLTFGNCSKLGKISSQAMTIERTSSVISGGVTRAQVIKELPTETE